MVELLLIGVVAVGSFVGYLYLKDLYIEKSKIPFCQKIKVIKES
jgi:hypothetical protein